MPTEAEEQPILVGSVARPHGLKGEVVVDVLSEVPERFAPGKSMTARPKAGAPRGVKVASARPFGDRLLVRFEGYATREDALTLHGADLTVARGETAPKAEGRLYRFELLGLRVRSREGADLGEVADVFATGSNDVYVVRGPAGELLLPALASVILEIDVDRGVMLVEVPPGLRD